MNRVVTLAAVAIVALVMPAWGAAGLDKHNVNSAGCRSCHVPHDADQSAGQTLIWAQPYTTTATFGTYTLQSSSHTAVELGGSVPAATDPRIHSYLCMSCHDGVTSTLITWTTNPTMAIADAASGTSYGLANDHPVNISYTQSGSADLRTKPTSSPTTVMLYGTNSDSLQCGTCHDPHDNTNGNFLRMANTNSALCTTCHNKTP